jgi:hypothetical protein
VGPNAKKSPGGRWQPQAEDFAAADWHVIRTIDELPLRRRIPSASAYSRRRVGSP